MKKILLLILTLAALAACNDDETYADQKDKERDAIEAFLKRSPLTLRNGSGDTLLSIPHITVISEAQFAAQDSMTDVAKNEFVRFDATGLYMQIVRKGAGRPIQSGEHRRVICRYWEYNILSDSLQTTNQAIYWATTPDIMDVTNNYGTITASFDKTNGGGAMYMVYNTTAVPTGWITPLTYVNLGRYSSEEGIAKVRLIVPHTAGQQDATSNVYPCFYEISYEAMRD